MDQLKLGTRVPGEVHYVVQANLRSALAVAIVDSTVRRTQLER